MKLIRSAGSKPAPEGVHAARVANCEEGTSKAGNPMLIITFELEDSGRELRAWVPTHVPFRVDQLIDAFCGPEDDELESETLLDKGCQVQVVHERYEGKITAKIEAIMPPLEGSDDTPF